MEHFYTTDISHHRPTDGSVLFFFFNRCPFQHKNGKFWPNLTIFGYFVTNLRISGAPFTGLNCVCGGAPKLADIRYAILVYAMKHQNFAGKVHIETPLLVTTTRASWVLKNCWKLKASGQGGDKTDKQALLSDSCATTALYHQLAMVYLRASCWSVEQDP